MNAIRNSLTRFSLGLLNKLGLAMRAKLIVIFLLVKVVPLILTAAVAWQQFTLRSEDLRAIAVSDSAAALKRSSVENIELMFTDTALRIAEFLYKRDYDILYPATLKPSEKAYRLFINQVEKLLIKPGRLEPALDGLSRGRIGPPVPYCPSEANGFSRRGLGFVTIGSGLESFTRPARATETKLIKTVESNLNATFVQPAAATLALIVIVVLIVAWRASFPANSIKNLIAGISKFRRGERQFRFQITRRDEFGALAYSFKDMADSLVDSVKTPLCVIGLDCNIIYMNKCGLALCKKTPEEVVRTDYGLISIYPLKSRYCPITALEEGREPDIVYMEDNERYYKGRANYLLDRHGQKTGYIIESIEVTEMVAKQHQLEEAMNAANQANAYKGEFLARMSHEIRTPMNAIIGLTNIIKEALEQNSTKSVPNLAEIKDYVRQIEASSQHLLCLLNDILDISKIEAGKISLYLETMNLEELAATVVSIIKPRCAEKNVELTAVCEPFQPTAFLSDPLRLRQVLINLLGNAVKFTPSCGRVEFKISRQDRQNKRALLKFTVSDSGIGMSPETLATIFQPFEQGGGLITSRYGGTGLGLSISRHIVNLFDSDIEVESRLNEGSKFSFAIWLEELETSPAQPPGPAVKPIDLFRGRKALLVDDVELNRKVARAMLKSTGLAIDEASDGLSALKKFEQSPIGGYDVILMDVQMPAMDGYQTSLAIRALSRADARAVPIIAQTANAFKADIDKALESGMNAHIAKPLKLDKLLEMLAKFIAR